MASKSAVDSSARSFARPALTSARFGDQRWSSCGCESNETRNARSPFAQRVAEELRGRLLRLGHARLHRPRGVDGQADRQRQVRHVLELRHLHGLPFVEHLERVLLQVIHRMAVAQHRRRQLDEMDVDLFHELRRVEHHHVFDGRLLGDVLERGDGAEVADAFRGRHIDDLNKRGPEECRYARFVEEQFELVELLPFRNLDCDLHARAAVQLQRDAGRNDADAERIVAGVHGGLVTGDHFSFVVQGESADPMDLRHAAEVEIERVRGLALAHHLSSVEIELDVGDAIAFDDGVDVLQAAEQLVRQRQDADRRRVPIRVYP